MTAEDTPPQDTGTDDETAAEDQDRDDTPPTEVQDEAETLTRRAREAVDDAEARAYRDRRDALLAEYDYTARVRDEDRAVLVLHPAEWLDGDTVDTEAIDDLDRGIERPLEGPGESDEWEEIAAQNGDIVDEVRAEHGEVHGANAQALAEFCNNHYAKPIGKLTPDEREEFLSEYYPRNVWPNDEQKSVVAESVRLTVDVAQRLTERSR